MKKIEIACFHLESALIAQKAGVNRVELCSDMLVGGITPSAKILQQARQNLAIDLYVMIRPRGGDFVYSMQELMLMQLEILEAKEMGVDGFVFGILTKENKVDVAVNKAFVELANPLPCTFHRAFDQVENYQEALEDVISCGFSTILTSGGFSNVIDGKARLQQLVIQANNRIEIMPGGGLRSNNISELNQMVNANWYHSSAVIDTSEIASLEEMLTLKNNLLIS